MKMKYYFSWVILSMALAGLCLIINVKEIISIPVAFISYLIFMLWILSKNANLLLKDIMGKIGNFIGLIIFISSMIGLAMLPVVALIRSTKEVLIHEVDPQIWPRYDKYFLMIYLIPITIIILVLQFFFKKLRSIVKESS
jgi:hypothetical protein